MSREQVLTVAEIVMNDCATDLLREPDAIAAAEKIVDALSDGQRIKMRDDGGDRIDVIGPAIVRTPAGAEYEVGAGMTLAFPAPSEVWLKLWPKEQA